MKTKVRWCMHCGRKTIQELVGKEAVAEGLGPIRVLLAVCTVGITETVGVDKYYQCRSCGNIDKEI